VRGAFSGLERRRSPFAELDGGEAEDTETEQSQGARFRSSNNGCGGDDQRGCAQTNIGITELCEGQIGHARAQTEQICRSVCVAEGSGAKGAALFMSRTNLGKPPAIRHNPAG